MATALTKANSVNDPTDPYNQGAAQNSAVGVPYAEQMFQAPNGALYDPTVLEWNSTLKKLVSR